METKNENYGLIYVLTNECMPDLVKIGRTTRHELKKRMNELYSTGVPAPFECACAYKVEMNRLADVEKGLHSLFDEYRVPSGREFFSIKAEKVEIALNKIGNFQIADDATKEVQTEIDDVVAADDKKQKNPNMDFFKMGLKEGQKLVFVNSKGSDHVITCTVYSYRKVWFDGQAWSLSRLTHKFVSTKWIVRPAPYWETEDGSNLLDLYIKYVENEAKGHQSVIAKNASDLKELSAELEPIINAKV